MGTLGGKRNHGISEGGDTPHPLQECLRSSQKEVGYREIRQAVRCRCIRIEAGEQEPEAEVRRLGPVECCPLGHIVGQPEKPVQGWGEPGALAHTKIQSSYISGLEDTLGNILPQLGLFPEGNVSSGEPNLELSSSSASFCLEHS